MTNKILHVLSQRPSLTGSGVTLEAMVRHAARAGWDQQVVIGVPAHDRQPGVADLPPDKVHPLVFGQDELPFALPGMSDIMPYPSTCFSSMGPDQIESYRRALCSHLEGVIGGFAPDVIHSHHVWLMSSFLKDIAPHIPVLTHCHATGLRQMKLCPDLAETVKTGCRRNEHFAVLMEKNARELALALDLPLSRITVVGAGFREELFHTRGRFPAGLDPELLYVGKYSHSKGLPWLLDAVEQLGERIPELRLHVAGSGGGEEAERLRLRMEALTPLVEMHGQLGQPDLADLMRRCRVMVLPSFYEGLPLVLVEARACGLQIVATALEGIADELAPHFGSDIELVSLPRLRNVDQPHPDDEERFVRDLAGAIGRALAKQEPTGVESLERFTWNSVFDRVQMIWMQMMEGGKRE